MDYKKKKNVFRIRNQNGTEFLFQAKDQVCFIKKKTKICNINYDLS